MRLAITQPTFMPWCGYFSLMNNVDEIVFLDNVQFTKRSWQQRNKIKLNDKELMLTVPVFSKNKFKQNIDEVKINKKSGFIDKHLKTLNLAYRKSNFYEKYSPEIEKIYQIEHDKLLDLNISIIYLIKNILNIKTKISFSSELKLKSKKENLINEICLNKNCSSYITTLGSKDYLTKLKKTDYKILYYDFKDKKYSQLGNFFLSRLSIIDLLFNIGPKSNNYLLENFKLKK